MQRVLVLLPPSEGKATGGRGGPLDLSRLSSPALTPVRERLVAALERAAADGVRIELVVRGICTLRPVPAGEAGHIHIAAGTGRFVRRP